MVIRKHHIIERSDLVSRRNKKIEITLSIWLKENSQIVAICNFCFTSNNLQTSRGQGEKKVKKRGDPCHMCLEFTVMLFMHLLKSQIAALNTKVVNFEAV